MGERCCRDGDEVMLLVLVMLMVRSSLCGRDRNSGVVVVVVVLGTFVGVLL